MSDAPQQRRFRRWVLPILSPIPVIIGIVDVCAVTGPGDQKMSAGMGLAFFFFPVSFLLALTSALLTWKRWKAWPRVDRVIGLAPLLLLLATLLTVILFAALGG